ncbi:CIR protein [Plasmodium chabaudi chabaudi]|uniref:CIR protein n=1 Tax=Plasmodium chabaudi chabaudi TaxID=31271 RepID=A0A4V0K1B2_PLACU|nr:CIR protein [Plasmodium chabaudi chabaudi]VTZ66326.1 CIR protein [Plasmodium chabaudi chabaudi]|eukprot:XP_016653041.1 CIR protein [Plasmodium chabaudi chabaudi]
MSEELCEKINQIEEYITFDSTSQKYMVKNEILNSYCPGSENGGKGQCGSNEELLGSAFMALLVNFKGIEDEKLEDDKIYQYAVLWLSYKIRENPNIEFIRSTIPGILEKNQWYKELSKSADDKENTMGFHFIYLTNLYKFLKGICETINKCKGSPTSSECKQYGEKCSGLYRACLMHFPWKEICNPYCSVLSNLKNDYEKIREKYSLPELNLPQGLSDCNAECSKKASARPNGLPGLPVIPTSINNGNKLPYIAVPLVLIPIILGISYKYLTPVWRKKMKKKTMKKIINLSDPKKA